MFLNNKKIFWICNVTSVSILDYLKLFLDFIQSQFTNEN